MSTETICQTRCDRSGQIMPTPAEAGKAPDLAVCVPWLPDLGELAAAAQHGVHSEGLDCCALQDISDGQRLIVVRLLARLLKLPERHLLGCALAVDGSPLRVALGILTPEAPEAELELEPEVPEPEPEPEVPEPDPGADLPW